MELQKISKENIFIAVFSYNRGKYLENCVQSIERNLSTENIYIYDDDSDNGGTIRILNKLSKKYFVEINREKSRNSERGGLYFNMNRALNSAIDKNFSYILFIQEDSQIVRKCDKLFFEEIYEIFKSDNDIVLISPLFLKNEQRNRKIRINKNPEYYYDEDVLYAGYDQGIYRVNTIKERQWHFDNGEQANVLKSKKLKLKYVICKNPMMMFLSNTQIRRRESFIKSLFVKIIEFFSGMGFYPYRDILNKEVQEFLSREVAKLPFAEEYLETKKKTRKPWKYSRSDYPFINIYLFFKEH